jgi:beta-fructofuranosidase
MSKVNRREFAINMAAAGFAGLVNERAAAGQSVASLRSAATRTSGELFYRPDSGYVGDVIPFHDGNQFRIFHLHRFDGGGGTSWYQATTTDFVHFKNEGEMLVRGSSADQDLSVATGSVLKGLDGQYHAFYTGFNSITHKEGLPEQGVMHAISQDLLKWKKLPEHTFYAPQDRYERDDWRDPFVFWNAEAGEYWMLVAARLRQGPSRRRGCTALCTSKDLTSWQVYEPFWAPGLYFTHECPDLFRIGGWHYLVFSEFSETNQTRYRMRRGMRGQWITPEIDTFDTRALYAAKTVSDGRNRYLLGWNPTRVGNKDDGAWQWGGNLVVHQLVQAADGTLWPQMPGTISEHFSNSGKVNLTGATGSTDLARDQVRLKGTESAPFISAGMLPDRAVIECKATFAKGTRSCGLMLRTQEDCDSSYYVRLEPPSNRVVIDRWPRPGDQAYMAGMERPLTLTPSDPVHMRVIVDGSVAEVYINDRVALSTRLYELKRGSWGVFVQEGDASFADLRVLEGS